MHRFVFQVNSWLKEGTTRNRLSSGKPFLIFSQPRQTNPNYLLVQAHLTRPRKGKEEGLKGTGTSEEIDVCVQDFKKQNGGMVIGHKMDKMIV